MRTSECKSLQEDIADSVRFVDKVDLVIAGIMIIIPSTFVVVDRYMRQMLQEIMGISEIVGKPDIFITMTCNPNWLEIQSHLLEG